MVLGLTLFTVAGEAAQGNDDAPSWQWALVMVGLALVSAALITTGGRGSLARKASSYGACVGVLFGLSAALWKPTGETLASGGVGAMLSNWEFWAFAAAGIVAFLVQQVSLATGRLAPSVAMTSVLNPLVGIFIGTLLLDERLADPGWHKALAYGGLALALLAAVSITRATEEAKHAESPDVPPSPATTSATYESSRPAGPGMLP